MKKILSKFTLFLLVWLSAAVVFADQDPFSLSWDAQTRTVQRGDTVGLSVLYQIPPGHYLYEDKAKIFLREGEGLTLESISLSPSVLKFDRFSNKTLQIFEEFAMVTAQIKVAKGAPLGMQAVIFEVQYQGCSPKLCFRQQAKPITIDFVIAVPGALAGADTGVKEGGMPQPGVLRPGLTGLLQRSLEARGWMAYGIAFLGGLLTDFTPCVIPLIPLTLAVIGIRREKSHRRNFIMTSVLVIGMAVTYAFFGVIAAMLGFQLGFLFQNPYFLLFGALLFLIFALGMFGAYELQLPLFLRNYLARVGGKGYGGAALAGMTMGLLAAPCVGPIIGALLVWVAHTQDLVQGFGLLFVFGLGMGSLILVIGTFYGALAGKLHGGTLSLWIKWVLGFLLLIPAAYYAHVAYGVLQSDEIQRQIQDESAFRWEYEIEAALARAQSEQKRVLVDFWAEWCIPCLEWDEVNFSKPRVQRALRSAYVPLKVDCTGDTPQCSEMVRRYNIVGWPTIMIIDAEGQLVTGSKIVGEVLAPDEFVKYLKRFSP